MVWFPIAGNKWPLSIVSENNNHFLGEEFGKGSTCSFVIQRHQLGEQLKDTLSAWPHHFMCVVPQCSLNSLSSLFYVVSPPSEPFLMTCAFYSMAVSGWLDFLRGSSRVIIPGRNGKVSYDLASVVPEPYFHPTQLAKQIIQAGPHWRGRGWRRSRFYFFLGELHGQTGRGEINGGHLKAVIAGENIFSWKAIEIIQFNSLFLWSDNNYHIFIAHFDSSICLPKTFGWLTLNVLSGNDK